MNTMPIDGNNSAGVAGSMHNPSLGTASRDVSHQQQIKLLERQIAVLQLQLENSQALIPAQPVNTRIPVPAPSKFDGKIEDDAARQWIMEVKDAVSLFELQGGFSNEMLKIIYAATSLNGHAKEAWFTQRSILERIFTKAASPELQWNCYEQLTLDGFLEWIKTKFEDINAPARCQQEYNNCVQGNRPVSRYLIEFSKLAERIEPPIPDFIKLEKFKEGLSLEVHNALSYVLWKPMDLKGFARVADKIDTQLQEEKARHGSSKGGSTQSKGQSSKSNPSKSDLKQEQGTSMSRIEWTRKCQKEGLCFKCGQKGHQFNDCIVKVPNKNWLTMIEESNLEEGNGEDQA